jgi:hypothetical protein
VSVHGSEWDRSHNTALSKPAFEVVRILDPSSVSEALGTVGASGKDVVWYVTVYFVHALHDFCNDIVLGLAGRHGASASWRYGCSEADL